MKTQYVTADELVDTLGVSKGKAYQIIRQLNEELAEQGYIKIAGKCPRKYFEKRYYGYTSEAQQSPQERFRYFPKADICTGSFS